MPVTQFHFERNECSQFEQSIEREWLVTNGIGGFASSTLCNTNTRRYHGLLTAAFSPPVMPKFISNVMGARVRGFFVTTEDGSSSDNRIVAGNETDSQPMLDYDLARIPASSSEHNAIIKAFRSRLLRCGLISVSRAMGLTGTAHALGSLVMGNDPTTTVVDANGKVHGINNLYVADGSVLPRASRVNPALTIYALGLRLGQWLIKEILYDRQKNNRCGMGRTA